MAFEAKRGCGYRKVGGMYLVGDYISVPCDRLPYPLDVCPVCGGGIKVGRGMTKIIPLRLFGQHTVEHKVEVTTGAFTQPTEWRDVSERCGCHFPCFMCDPKDEVAYIMGVGEKYYPTPEHFTNEGITPQGVAKRIAQIPKEFEIGNTIVYLAHPKACRTTQPVAVQQAMNILEDKQPTLIDSERVEKHMGIFSAFIPQRIEKLYWQSELDAMTDKDREQLARRGISPVAIPDGDKDHA